MTLDELAAASQETAARYGSNAGHSQRADVTVLGGTVEGRHTQLAAVRLAFDRMEEALQALFDRYEACRADLQEVGVDAQFQMGPMCAAAYDVHFRDEQQQSDEFPEIPLMPLEGE